MRLVIIESPYKGDVTKNTRYLRSCIRDCIRRGESPYASHRMLTDALDDDDPVERTQGIEAGLAWRNARQEDGQLVLHVFYVDLGTSGGMGIAKERYDNEGIPYEIRNLPADDPFFLFEGGRIVVHLKEYSEFNSGPHIRKCTECGVRLWIPADGVWTDNRSTWLAPPAGYVSCATWAKERREHDLSAKSD